MLDSAFKGSLFFEHLGKSVFKKRRSWTTGEFVWVGFGPSVRVCNVIDVVLTGNFDVLFCLFDINTIVCCCKAEVIEGRFGLFGELKFLTNDGVDFVGQCFVGTGNEEVVDLS